MREGVTIVELVEDGGAGSAGSCDGVVGEAGSSEVVLNRVLREAIAVERSAEQSCKSAEGLAPRAAPD